MNHPDSNNLAVYLQALAHPKRLEIIALSAELGPMQASLFSEVITVSKQDLHRHLKLLVAVGVMTNEGTGRMSKYKLADPVLPALLTAMAALKKAA